MRNESLRSTGDRDWSRTLTDRVRARVDGAVDQEGGGKAAKRARQPSSLTNGNAESREARSIDQVYCEMRTLYRRYRRRTKRPAVPALREAVQAYKRGPSLPRLVAVASFLDDRGLLGW
ncbi:MAG: hypothetical protein AB7L66_18680 [Gemmatimonadales bacterium]